MPSLEMSIPHNLSQQEAKRRIQELLPKMKSDYADQIKDLHEEWKDNTGKFSFSIMGFAVSGTLNVNESTVDLDGNLPFAATFFKGKIKSVIQEKAQEILA
ncbi:MAG: polyhydroxyalkanoic acid system family protein [Chitinophagaceae bacterium]|nr:polyhydroxyalkanoic acid system family protein [Chitinophagaceae bacterium]